MLALQNYNLDDIVLLDIETVRIEKDLKDDTPLFDSWEYKMRYSSERFDKEGDIYQLFNDKAPLFAEFAKIVCITIGSYRDGKIVLKSYYDHNERILLEEFSRVINALQANNKNTVLAGHAIKGFDIPFIMRRLIVNRLPIPPILDIAGLKPWLVNVIDTKELWQSSGFYSSSLINIAVALGLPSPKSIMDGSETSDYYYNNENGLELIKNYCEDDVFTVGNIILIFKGLDIVERVLTETITIQEKGILEQSYNRGSITDEHNDIINNIYKDLTPEEKVMGNEIINLIKNK